jgi:hypothetical protein
VEEICTQVCQRFHIAPERLVWLEHYDFINPVEWKLVTFDRKNSRNQFTDPKWTKMTPALWRELGLRPKTSLSSAHGSLGSKLTKLFSWPTGEALLE